MAKIAMLGGTYDPIHNGHITLGRHFADLLGLDKVIVIPTKLPPHKAATATPGEMRLEMCRLAVLGDDVMEASDLELRRDGLSYSYDTVCTLRDMYPGDELYLIIGADMFMILEQWNRYEKLRELVTFCTVPRDETDAEELREYAKVLEAGGARTIISDGMKMDISSTDIRRACANGESIGGKTPPGVKYYILANRLYMPQARCLTGTERIEYTAYVRGRLGDDRFIHSVNVSEEAVRLAEKYGGDVYKAEVAGLLHDCDKEIGRDRLAANLKSHGLMDGDMEKSHRVWHAFSAAETIADELLIRDEDIIRAVRYHTTGRPGMSLLEKIIYIADLTSAERHYGDVDVVRGLAERSLDEAVRYVLEYTINRIRSKGEPVHPLTTEAFEEYKQIVTNCERRN